MTLDPGTKLGNWEILEPLGAGGMGEVYRARDSRLAREVAVKVLREEFLEGEDRKARFEREARLLAALNHPNIAAIYSFEEILSSSESSPRHLLVMELLEGETLRARLSFGALAPRRALEIAIPIAHGLAAANEKGIVHRDLKPDNVFLTKDGRVKILDFGLAKLAEPEGSAEPHTHALTLSAATRPGVVVGTMGYMSPEQVRGGSVDARSDLFAFGAMLYEMLSGRRAFRGDTAADTLSAILREDPPELVSTGSVGVPLALDRLVRHCLEKSPDRRFQSARDLAFALEAEAFEEASGPGRGDATRPFAARKPTTLERLPGRALPVLAVAFGLGVAFFGGWSIGKGRPGSDVRFTTASYGRGTISSARFGADGRSVVYAAAWNGLPSRLFQKAADGPDGVPLEFPRAEILAISRASEMAVLLDPRPSHVGLFTGTLARAPVTGGAPREIALGVSAADWSPDGATLLAVREGDGKASLEYPVGTVLYRTAGHIGHPRLSPRGDRIAFFDHPIALDDRGTVAVIDLLGKKKTLTREFGSLQGLAWSPAGDEVWFTGAELFSIRSLSGVSLGGRLRQILPGIGQLRLLDVSKEGRVLLARDTARVFIAGRGSDTAAERDLTWLDVSFARDISADGKTLLFESGADAAGPNYAVGLRGMDGSPVVRLGDGYASALSPDGEWALASLPAPGSPLDLLPTGTGQPRRIPVSLPERGRAVFSPDGRRILFTAREPGRGRRIYAVALEGGSPVPLSREAPIASALAPGCVSPDGRLAAASGSGGGVMLVPLDGGEARPMTGALATDTPLRWSADGRGVFVRAAANVPASVFFVEAGGGSRRPFHDFAPADLAGVDVISNVVVSGDGKAWAYSASRQLSELYLVEGLR